MDGLKGGEEDFGLDLKLNWKAVKLLEDGASSRPPGDDASSRVLDHSKVYGGACEGNQRGDETVDEDRSGVGAETVHAEPLNLS